MAKQIDATASIYYLFNQFIERLKLEEQMPDFDFISTSSIESIAAIIETDADKLVVLQKKLEVKKGFTDIEYNIIPSFATKKDLNALLTAKVFSLFEQMYPKYYSLEVYEAIGLEKVNTEFNPTGYKMVITKQEQAILGSGQLRNNFNSLKVNFVGYLG